MNVIILLFEVNKVVLLACLDFPIIILINMTAIIPDVVKFNNVYTR